jgi:NADPH:quinone reductase-like Zn-dependent oxidoreductase
MEGWRLPRSISERRASETGRGWPPPPASSPGHAVRAAGINPSEAKIRAGLVRDSFPATFPSGQGSDLASVVEEVGAGVKGVAVGDEVVAQCAPPDNSAKATTRQSRSG